MRVQASTCASVFVIGLLAFAGLGGCALDTERGDVEGTPDLIDSAGMFTDAGSGETLGKVEQGLTVPVSTSLIRAITVPVATNISWAYYSYDWGVDRPGGDYRHVTSDSAASCRSLCAAETKCASFTFVSKGYRGSTAGVCWLKSQVIASKTADTAIASGVVRENGLEYQVDRAGNDYRSFDLSSSDPARCKAACVDEASCKAFTYVLQKGGLGRCWLKSSAGTPKHMSGVTSGYKKSIMSVLPPLLGVGIPCGSCDKSSDPTCGCPDWSMCSESGYCEPAGGTQEACWEYQPVGLLGATLCKGNLGCVDNTCVSMGVEGTPCRSRARIKRGPAVASGIGNPPAKAPDCDGDDLHCGANICTPLPRPGPQPACVGWEGCMCDDSQARYIDRCHGENLCDQNRMCRDTWELTFQSLYASQAVYDVENGDREAAKKLLALVDLSLDAYSDELGPDAEAIIASNPDLIVVSIAGSESAADWINNLDVLDDFGPTAGVDAVDMVNPDEEYKQGWIPCVIGRPAACNFPAFKVHQNFMRAAYMLYHLFVREELNKLLANNPRPVQFVGHSLGGAIAQLLAAHAKVDMGIEVDAVVTFGSPKVGDANWRNLYDSLLYRSTHRWVNYKDLVPNTPFKDVWQRAGQQHYLNADQEARLDDSAHARSFRESVFDDHRLWSSYKPALEQAAGCENSPLDPVCGYKVDFTR